MAEKDGNMEQAPQLSHRTAEEAGIELVLVATKALYTSRKTLKDTTFDRAKQHCKIILKRTSENETVRRILGHSFQMWKDLTLVLSFAIPALEAQSIAVDDPSAPTNTCCAATMVSNYDTLMTDLLRLNDLLLIARNCLATTPKAQNLAGESLLDQQVLKLIDLCVRITARGYDGESGGSGTKTEKLWASIIGMCELLLPCNKDSSADCIIDTDKKLLITCLQLLHNFITQNDQRKLLLWLDLFANSRIANEYVSGVPYGRDSDHMRDLFEAKLAEVQSTRKANGHSQWKSAKEEKVDDIGDGVQAPERARGRDLDKIASGGKNEKSEDNPKFQSSEDASKVLVKQDPKLATSDTVDLGDRRQLEVSITQKEDDLESAKAEFGALRSPESAAVTLKAAKDQLMARLREPAAINSLVADDGTHPLDPARTRSNGEEISAEGQYPEEEEEEYQDTGELGDQTRGLLTDIPLVLGPQEIEALPMIIQIAICPGLGRVLHGRDMQSLRCNILLAGESGRNLLRELLIFIAAWDLQDDEVYFLLMKQIMEAVLENGLMPYAYQTFAEVKDIVSPAQSMVIKILTQIFRGKHGLAVTKDKDKEATRKDNPHADASRRVDIYIVRYIFTMFRSSIIPETCALIYLQGQIKAGAALPEDFPLNLWDMERVYEGVYQFLEFFAVLTESTEWKEHLVTWEIVSELITLLRELDASIPKAPIAPLSQSLEDNQPSTLQAETNADIYSPASPSDVDPALREQGALQSTAAPIVERPFDPDPVISPDAPELEINDPYVPASPLNQTASESDAASIESADPADFEWRNLKKLVILVLSSLVWKSPKVQMQIRHYGGVELVLGCINYDGHNPYIREHAVMCMRFLLEGNSENEQIVSKIMGKKEGLEGVVGEDLAEEWLKRCGVEEGGERT